jgi:hypothetical protein
MAREELGRLHRMSKVYPFILANLLSWFATNRMNAREQNIKEFDGGRKRASQFALNQTLGTRCN